MPWAVLLARVFYLDALLCVKCGGKRKVPAFLTDPQVLRKILEHVGLEMAPLPLAPARVGEREPRLWTEEEGERGMGQERGLSARELGSELGKRGLGAGSTLSETGP
jgi:hypothetical protein